MLTSGPMGAALWVAAGVAAFVCARIIPIRRTARWMPELMIAIVIAAAGGVAATLLDFGGWNEADWRAGTFAILLAFGAVGVTRSIPSESRLRTSDRRSSSD